MAVTSRQSLTWRHFESLEVLRGLAAVYVMLAHARGNLWIGSAHLKAAGELHNLGLFDGGCSCSTS